MKVVLNLKETIRFIDNILENRNTLSNPEEKNISCFDIKKTLDIITDANV